MRKGTLHPGHKLWYNSPKYQASYKMNFKCASTAIRRLLEQPGKTTLPSYRPFSVVRDPFSRAISIYMQMVRMDIHLDLNFTTWLEYLDQEGFYDKHQFTQVEHLSWGDYEGEIRIFRIDQMDKMCDWLGAPVSSLRPANESNNKPSLTDKDRELITKLWEEDFELWESQMEYE